MKIESPRLAAGGVSGWVWLSAKAGLFALTVNAAVRLGRQVWWLVSWWREPGLFTLTAVVAYRVQPVAVLGVAVAAVGYLIRGRGRMALEAERRDRMRVARHWTRSRLWPIRWAANRPPAWAVSRSGHRVNRIIPGVHLLIGGMTGAGKSGAVNAALYSCAGNSHVHMVGIDLKGGLELMPWAARCDAMATNPAEAIAVLLAVRSYLDVRVAEMLAKGIRELPDAPSATWPRIVVVVDELEELFSDPDTGKQAEQIARSIARIGRAPGVSLITATQSPLAEVIPSPFRSQHAARAIGAVDSADLAHVVAGRGRLGKEFEERYGTDACPWNWRVSESSGRRDAGRFLLLHDGIEEVRFVWRSDPEIAAMVRKTALVAWTPLITLTTGATTSTTPTTTTPTILPTTSVPPTFSTTSSTSVPDTTASGPTSNNSTTPSPTPPSTATTSSHSILPAFSASGRPTGSPNLRWTRDQLAAEYVRVTGHAAPRDKRRWPKARLLAAIEDELTAA